MLARTLSALLLLLSLHVSAQDRTPTPLDCRSLPWDGGFATCNESEEVPPYDTRFRWLRLFQQTNNAAVGENVTVYSKQRKQGAGSSWAFVAEAACMHERGGCHGAEIDLMVSGPVQWGDWRLGQSIVIWSLGAPNPQAHFGLLVAPEWTRRNEITSQYGVHVDLVCTIACMSVREDQKICLEATGKVCLRLNTHTRRVELLNGERVLTAWPVD